MDHAGIAQDREDLERYRQGLQPIKRKEYLATPITVDKMIFETLKHLEKKIKKQKRLK